MSHVPGGPMQRIAREVRPGVNGSTFWNTGVRSEPIQLATVVDCANVNAATQLLRAYEATVGQVVSIDFAGDNLDGVGILVADVQPIEGGACQTVLGVGGTLGTSSGLLRCVWILQPIHPLKESR